ncbi:hypothetical protein Tco_0031422 [Tanacetum coccineum]
MAVLESCPKHSMVAYLEKTDGNAEFHEIIDFLERSSIHNALTVSPVVSTMFVEQFWMSAKSKIINNVRYITAKVVGKPVSISEASIRSDLLFDDADRIDSLPNQAIFDAIQLMGYEGDLTLMNVPVPLDHFPVNALTSKVFSFMVKKGKHFSGKVTPLFFTMLVQPTEDEGKQSERPSEPQPTPSPPYPSEANVEPQSDPSPRPSSPTHIPNSIPEDSGRNQGGQSSSDRSLSGNEGGMTLQSVYDLCISLCTQVTDQAKEIKHFKEHIKKLKKRAKPVITHNRAWMKSVSLKQRLAGKKSLKKNWMQKESLDDDEIDNMDTEDAQDVGRTRNVVNEEKEGTEDAVSTKDVVSTDKEKVSTDRSKVSTDRSRDSTDKEKDGTDKEKDSTDKPDECTVDQTEGTIDQTEGRSATPTTPTNTLTMFGDDETIAQVLLNMSQAKAVSRENEKGIDPKDKGKKKNKEEDESNTKSEGIPEAEKKFKQLARDKEMARKVQEDWEAEEEVKKLAEEEAIKAALSNEYNFIQAIIKADRLLALRLQDEERERAVHCRRKSKVRNQMMTYLKHVGNKKHSDLKSKTFEEIQALYEKVKRFNDSFTAVGSTEDERKIKEINKAAKDLEHKKVAKETPKEEDIAKVPAKVDVTEQGTKKRKGGHMKMIARKRKRPQSDVDSDDEHRKCLKVVTFEGTIDSEIIERKSVIDRLDKVSSPDGDYLVIYRANGNFRAFNYLMEVLHIFDRQDLFHLYDLMMENDLWGNQQDWKIVTWRLYEACGVYILELEDGIVIRMLVERRYPLSKDLLQRMLDFRLEVERESTIAHDLIRVLNSPCFMVKSWLVQDQTVLGKDYSNMLIADSLLKTIWFINAPCYGNEALASPKANELTIPEQTATGKGTSNPFMADTVMSDSDESGVTHIEISSPFEDLSDIGSPGVVRPEHEGLPWMLDDPYVQEDEVFSAEEKPLPAAASPTAQSPDYVPESDPEEDPEEDDDVDPEEDHVDYPADGGDDGDEKDEPSDDDKDEEVDIEADDEEEEEHPAPADSAVVALPTADQAPFAEETESFEIDGSTATPPPHPAYRVTARISISAPVPTPVWSDAEVARLLAISTPPSSPLSPWSSPLPQIPSPPLPSILSPLPVSPPLPQIPSPPLPVSSQVPVLSPSPPASPIRLLGYQVAMIRLRAEVASTSHSLPLPPLIILSHTRPDAPSSRTPPLHLLFTDRRKDIPEVTLPPRKRLGIALGPRYEIEESSCVVAARLAGVEAMQGMTEFSQRMTELETRVRQDTEVYTRLDDEQTRRQLLVGRLNMLFRDRRAQARTARLMETEARMSREAWGRSMGASDLARAKVMSLRTTVLADHRRQTVNTEMLAADRRRQKHFIEALKLMKGLQTQMAELQRQQRPANGPTQLEPPEEAGSSS